MKESGSRERENERALRKSEFNPITEGNIWKELLFFMIPIILSSLFQQLYNTVDAMVVGRYVGKEALGAVDSTGSFTRLLIYFFIGVSAGASIIISQYIGKKDKKAVENAVHTAAAFALMGGAAITVLGIALAPYVLKLMMTPSENYDYALLYMRIYFLGTLPTVIYNMGAGILKAAGDSKRPFYFLLISSGVNIALDILFVAILGMGVAGAAAATVMSQIVSAVLLILLMINTGESYRLRPSKIKITPEYLRSIVTLGLPRGIQSSLFSLSTLLIARGVNSFGTNAVASWAVAGKLDFLIWLFVEAASVSVTTFSGQNYGAKRYDRIFKSVHICVAYAFMMFIPTSLALYFFSGTLGKLFITDPVVLEGTVRIMHMYAPFYWVVIFTEVFSGAIQGTGETLKPMLITFFGVCVFRVIWILFILPVNNEFMTVVLSYPVSWILTAGIFIIYYKFGAWRNPIRSYSKKIAKKRVNG